MPLTQSDYYTWQEAVDLVSAALPEENSTRQLAQALHSKKLAAWALNGGGEYIPIPPRVWGQGSLALASAFTQGLIKFGKPIEITGFVKFEYRRAGNWISGTIQISRSGLDKLLELAATPIHSGGANSSVKSLASAEHKCGEWIKGLDPKEDAPKNRTQMETTALSKFKGLSKKGFLRAWGTNAPEQWKQRGRKPARL